MPHGPPQRPMTAPQHEAELAGHLRTGDDASQQVTVASRWTRDSVTLTLSTGDEIAANRWPFFNAALFMQGAFAGRWRNPDGGGAQRLAVFADDDRTPIANEDFTRVLELATEQLQDAIGDSQFAHDTVAMRPPFVSPDDEPADIDRGMAELIAQLWGLGAITTDCCEDLGGQATVTFAEAGSAETFIAAVLRASRPAALGDVEPESLYNRIVLMGEEPDDWQSFRKRRMWRLHAQVREYGVLAGHDRLRADPDVLVAVTVSFPVADLPGATAAVRAANEQRGIAVSAASYTSPPSDD